MHTEEIQRSRVHTSRHIHDSDILARSLANLYCNSWTAFVASLSLLTFMFKADKHSKCQLYFSSSEIVFVLQCSTQALPWPSMRTMTLMCRLTLKLFLTELSQRSVAQFFLFLFKWSKFNSWFIMCSWFSGPQCSLEAHYGRLVKFPVSTVLFCPLCDETVIVMF